MIEHWLFGPTETHSSLCPWRPDVIAATARALSISGTWAVSILTPGEGHLQAAQEGKTAHRPGQACPVKKVGICLLHSAAGGYHQTEKPSREQLLLKPARCIGPFHPLQASRTMWVKPRDFLGLSPIQRILESVEKAPQGLCPLSFLSADTVVGEPTHGCPTWTCSQMQREVEKQLSARTFYWVRPFALPTLKRGLRY